MDVPEVNEKLQPIRDEFLVRFYHWSAEFSRREFDRNFPTLRQIKNPSLVKLISFARSLGRTERSLLCSALLKRFHQRAVELLEELPSTEETVLFERSLEARRVYVPEIDGAQYKAIIRRPNKTPLRKILLSKLAPVLGKPEMIGGNREEWTYSFHIRCWTGETWIDTGGQRAFGYSHAIKAHGTVSLDSHISVLAWTGVSSQTDWFYLSEEEYSEAAECLVHLCTLFLDALPVLLDGLSHDLPEPEVRSWRTPFVVKGHRKNGFTILGCDEPELRRALRDRSRSAWDIPTSIIPERLRSIGSHLVVIQDPSFTRTNSEDPLALNATYKHVRVEPKK